MAILDKVARLFGEPAVDLPMEVEPARVVAAVAAVAAKPAHKPTPRRGQRFGFDGAKRNRLNYDWTAGNTGANTEIMGGLTTLRNRCSDLARNNPHAVKALESLTSNLVSSGIRARWEDARAQVLWDTWIEQCDVSSDLDYYGQQALAVRGWLERGDIIARRRWRRLEDGLAVPMQIELLEGDFLDHDKNGTTPTGGRIVQGIEYDPIGRRVAYWLFKSHPGETGVVGPGAASSSPVPASDIAHLYRPTRPGQVRGIPWLAAVIQALRDLGGYEAAERNRKRSQAGLIGVVTPRDDVTYDEDGTDAVGAVVTDSDGNAVDEIEPNSWYVARGGSGVTFTNPSSDAGYPDYMRTQLRAVGAGCLLPYEVLTGDLSQVNYSSIRLGLVEFQRLNKAMQTQVIIPLLCRPQARWFLEAAIAAGTLRPGTAMPKWVLPEREEIDRETAVKSATMAVRAGFSSRQDQVASQGGDAGEVLREIVADLEALDAAGITLDTDPRHPATGPLQPIATQEPTP